MSTCLEASVEVVLEEFPEPTPVRTMNGRGEASAKVHLTDSVTRLDQVHTLCGQTAVAAQARIELPEIDELPLGSKCLRCIQARSGAARIKRLT